jgi:hypothetical protein
MNNVCGVRMGALSELTAVPQQEEDEGSVYDLLHRTCKQLNTSGLSLFFHFILVTITNDDLQVGRDGSQRDRQIT